MISREEYQEAKALYVGLMVAFFVSATVTELTDGLIAVITCGFIASVLLIVTIHKEKKDFGDVRAINPMKKKERDPSEEKDVDEDTEDSIN